MIGARSLSRSWLAACLALSLFAEPRTARASDASDRAAALFRQAQQAFERKNYAAAGAAFEQASELAPHAAAWLDAGESWELDGNLPRAAEDCDRALAVPGASEAHRREAIARLARLVPRIGTLEITASRMLVLTIDGGSPVTVPARRRVAPGHHELTVGDPARVIAIDVAAGETRALDVTPPAPLTPAPAREGATPSRSSAPPLATWIAFGAGGVATVAALALGSATLAARSDYTAAPDVERRDAFYRVRAMTNVAWAIAGAAAITGGVLWIIDARAEPRARVGVALGGGVAILAAETRF
jgi:tetratricopeptide (TPR) repeat protein